MEASPFLSVSWSHIEVSHDLLGSYGIDKCIRINFTDLGDYFSGVRCAYDGVHDLFILVGKRAFAIDQRCSVSADGIDH